MESVITALTASVNVRLRAKTISENKSVAENITVAFVSLPVLAYRHHRKPAPGVAPKKRNNGHLLSMCIYKGQAYVARMRGARKSGNTISLLTVPTDYELSSAMPSVPRRRRRRAGCPARYIEISGTIAAAERYG